jgi:hypothetical protein
MKSQINYVDESKKIHNKKTNNNIDKSIENYHFTSVSVKVYSLYNATKIIFVNDLQSKAILNYRF